MGLFDSRLFSWLQPQKRPSASYFRSRALPGRRASIDSEFSTTFTAIVEPPDHESNWRTLDLDSKTLNQMSPAELIELMVDLSPELSAGLWQFLRLVNPGWEAKAMQLNADEVDTRAQTAVDEFLKNLHYVFTPEKQTPTETVLNVLFMGAWLRGAFAAELVLDDNGRFPLNIALPDPKSFRFRSVTDDVRGDLYQIGQWQDGVFVPLDRETVEYVPIDPLPGKPYGRSLMSPALFVSLFLLSMLHDIKRVVMQQGYPRLDLSVDFEKLAAAAPEDARIGTPGFDAWVTAVMDEVETVYSSLEPDDAYIHSDVITVNRPVGTVDASSIEGILTLIEALELMAARALKEQPLVLGITDSTTETNAIRQWEIQTATIKALQHSAEQLLENLLTLALECQGIQARVQFRFAELRASEMMRDAMTEAIQIKNAQQKYLSGWISQDQASEEVTGAAAYEEAPLVIDLGGQADLVSEELDIDASRAVMQHQIAQTRHLLETAVGEMIGASSNGTH